MLSDSRWLELPEHGRQYVSVGRAAERDQFVRLLDDTPGRSHVVAVSGEPWIGKTRLVNDFIRLAVARGWTVVSGHAVHQPRRTPFDVLADSLAGSGCRSCGRDAGEYPDGRTCPLVGVISRPLNRTRQIEPARACGVLDLLDSGGRLLLVIDDLHWADDATVNVLPRLARLPGPGRLLVVVAYRPHPARFSVWRMLAIPEVGAHATRITLAPLTDEEAGHLLPSELSPSRRRALLHVAEGNPGLLCGLAATWPDETPAPLVEDAVANWLQDFDALSSRGWTTLRSAVLLGEPFEPEPLERVAQLPRTDVLVALDELVRNDLVRWEPYGRALRFRNPLVRILADWSAGPEWRLGAHLRATEALPADAVPARRRASLSANWEVALSMPDRTPFIPRPAEPWHDGALRGPDGLERELAMGERLATSGRLVESLALFADLIDRTDGTPTVLARIAWWRAWTWRLTGGHREAYGELGAALDDLPSDEDELRARLARARLAVALESGEDADDATKGVAETVYACPEPISRVHALALLAVHDVRRDHVEQAEHRVSQAVPWLGEMVGSPVEQLDALGWLGVAAADIGRPEVAAWCHRSGLGLADRHGITSAIPRFAMWLGELEVTEGELAQATWHQSLARKVAAYLRSDFLLDAVIRLERMIERTAKDRAAGGAAEPDLPLTQLSQRELDVARLVGAGQTNQQIARNLGLSHKTVETYLTRIFKKLGASSRSQVAAEIGRAG